MKVCDFVRSPAVSALPSTPISSIARQMADEEVGSLVIVDSAEHVLGIVTDRDLVVRGLAEGFAPSTSVESVMSAPATTVRDDVDVSEATEVMSLIGCRRLPLVDAAGQLTGVVSLDDLMIYVTRQTDRLTEAIAFETVRPRHGAK